VSTLLKITGFCKLISFYRYIYFDGPGVTKFSGIGLLLVIGLTLSLSVLAGCGAANGASEENSGTKVELLRADSPCARRPGCPRRGVFLALSERG
jgi:hypothetical protein